MSNDERITSSIIIIQMRCQNVRSMCMLLDFINFEVKLDAISSALAYGLK